MLELKVYDEDREVKLKFEHSLLALSKWESKHKKPFLTADPNTSDEMIDYIQCMLLSPEDEPELVYLLSAEQLEECIAYVNETRTASSVPKDRSSKTGEIVTSELIYYWMVGLKIPFHPTETWHLSRVMMLVQIVNFKSQPPKKQKASEMMSEWQAANAARRAEYGTTG